MTPSQLFTLFQSGQLELANRIVTASMCHDSAEHGCMPNRHLIHLDQLARSGAALLTVEATTAILPEGRITYADAGLWSDETEAAMGRVLASIRRHCNMPFAIQLAHDGRKASNEVPWKEGGTDRSHWRKGMANSCPFGACASAEREPAGCARRRALRQHLHLFDK